MKSLPTSVHDKLQSQFSPTHLEVIDDSHLHVGHAGAQPGQYHLRVVIAAAELDELTMIAQHRLIYDCLADEMRTHIHALAIEVIPSDSTST